MSSSEAVQDAYLGHCVSAPARLNTYSWCIKTRPLLRRALEYLPSFMSSSEAGQDAYLGHWVSAPARLNIYSCYIKPARS